MTAVEALRIKYSDPVDPWEEIDTTEWGRVPAWKAAALAGGAMNVYAQVRNDAVEAQTKIADIEEREQVVTARERATDARDRAFKDAVAKFMDRAAPFVDRIEQQRADQEREPEEPLPAPPSEPAEPPPGAIDAALPGDPSEGDNPPEPSLALEDEEQPAHGDPPGALHTIRGKENPDVEPDTRGEFLRRHDETEFPDPQLPAPPTTAQPISAGLDGGD